MGKSSSGGQRSTAAELQRSRIHTPGCEWDYTEACRDGLLALKDADYDAWEMMAGLIKDAFETGLDPDENGGDQYSVPVGKKVDRRRHFSRKPMPWLGELKAEATVAGKQGFVDYRLYFLETKLRCGGETDLILGSSLPHAGKGVAGGYDDDGQTDDMKDAMWKGIRWCDGADPKRLWRTYDSPC